MSRSADRHGTPDDQKGREGAALSERGPKGIATMIPANDIIEGSCRVISTRGLSNRPFRQSPNRQRAVARIIFWNAGLFAAVVYIPILLG